MPYHTPQRHLWLELGEQLGHVAIFSVYSYLEQPPEVLPRSKGECWVAEDGSGGT